MKATEQMAQALIVIAIFIGGWLFNCYMAGRWLTWKEWVEFNGD